MKVEKNTFYISGGRQRGRDSFQSGFKDFLNPGHLRKQMRWCDPFV